MKKIGDRILEQLEKLNLSQKDLADKVNVQEATISRYVNNERQPRSDILSRIASVLGVSIEYLLGTKSEENKIPTNELFVDQLISGYKEKNIDLDSLTQEEKRTTN